MVSRSLSIPSNPADRHFNEKVSLFSPDDQEIQELDVLQIPKQVNFLDPIFAWCINRNRIFQVNEQRGYEILVYGGEGSLVRKIRKQYDPVRMTSETREALLHGVPDNSPMRDPAVFPDYLPPIHTLFSDEEGRLYAATFERGEQRVSIGVISSTAKAPSLPGSACLCISVGIPSLSMHWSKINIYIVSERKKTVTNS